MYSYKTRVLALTKLTLLNIPAIITCMVRQLDSLIETLVRIREDTGMVVFDHYVICHFPLGSRFRLTLTSTFSEITLIPSSVVSQQILDATQWNCTRAITQSVYFVEQQ